MGQIPIKIEKIHFIGIGGISMSGLAEILKYNGFTVTGSDDNSTAVTNHLKSKNIQVLIPNAKENITNDIDLVVYTAAIRATNPEYIAAKEKKLPMMERAELLGKILDGYEKSICVAGTHGKTTTTSILAEILINAGLDPTIQIGGHMNRNGANYHIGNSSYFVLEACEYNNSFLHWKPQIGLILNIDEDHLDFFGDLNGVINSFEEFSKNILPNGTLIINRDTPSFDKITKHVNRVISFGIEPSSEYTHIWGTNIDDSANGIAFDVMKNDEFLTRVNTPMAGRFNVLNVLACFSACLALEIPMEKISQGLQTVKGVKRRFEHKGTYNGAKIIDDYAHHPTEIYHCLEAVGKRDRIFCLFHPHTYSRTKNHLDDFARCFKGADKIMVLPIFPAREPFDPTISSEMLVEKIKQNGEDVIFVNNFQEAEDYLKSELTTGDLLLTLGAGEAYKVAEALSE